MPIPTGLFPLPHFPFLISLHATSACDFLLSSSLAWCCRLQPLGCRHSHGTTRAAISNPDTGNDGRSAIPNPAAGNDSRLRGKRGNQQGLAECQRRHSLPYSLRSAIPPASRRAKVSTMLRTKAGKIFGRNWVQNLSLFASSYPSTTLHVPVRTAEPPAPGLGRAWHLGGTINGPIREQLPGILIQ